MSEAAIFAFGSVMFVITTWATIAYGVASMHRLEQRDQETGPQDGDSSDPIQADAHARR